MFPLTPDQHHWLEVATEDEGWCSFTSCTPSRSRARTHCASTQHWKCLANYCSLLLSRFSYSFTSYQCYFPTQLILFPSFVKHNSNKYIIMVQEQLFWFPICLNIMFLTLLSNIYYGNCFANSDVQTTYVCILSTSSSDFANVAVNEIQKSPVITSLWTRHCCLKLIILRT